MLVKNVDSQRLPETPSIEISDVGHFFYMQEFLPDIFRKYVCFSECRDKFFKKSGTHQKLL